MKCAVISVGTELLMGQITDTNAVYISRQLNMLGIDVLYRYTVGDNDGRLREILGLAAEDCDLIITTGGLGPTEDDMTKETVSDFLGEKLVEDEEAKHILMEIQQARKHRFTTNNYKQYLLPEHATVFQTEIGTAPGFAVEKNGTTVICLPGPPYEMTEMFRRCVYPYLAKQQDSVIYYKVLRIFGKGESLVETKLMDLIDAQTDPTIATYAKMAECSVRVASKRRTLEEAKNAVEAMVRRVRERLGDNIYSEEDEDLVQVVGRKLIDRHITISCAESCTGGLFAGTLTDVPGISEVFERGIVTYTCRAKIEELGVREDTLERETAVSPEVARQMAEGLQKKTGSDVCVSVTGIAGPGGGAPEKPVGLIYIGCRYQGKTLVKKLLTPNFSREWNRKYAVLMMLDTVNRLIDGRPVMQENFTDPEGKDIPLE